MWNNKKVRGKCSFQLAYKCEFIFIRKQEETKGSGRRTSEKKNEGKLKRENELKWSGKENASYRLVTVPGERFLYSRNTYDYS